MRDPKRLTWLFAKIYCCYALAPQFENIWLRTKRKNADGKVVSGTGGVCYLYFPAHPTPTQRRVLASLGIN